MTWEQKLAACQALSACSLKMREPGDWYVSQDVEIKDKSILKGEYGNGTTPEEAVEDHWTRLTQLAAHEYLVTRAGGGELRKAVRWNGFMWDQVIEETSR